MYNEYDDEDDEYNNDNTELEEDIDEEDTPGPEEDESTTKPLSLLKKKGKMYFDEELVKDLIVNHYQPYLDYGINEKGKKVCISRDRADKAVEKEIMSNLLLIANAIINKYRYWKFEPLDDLQQESLKAMYVYLPNYVPGKGSCFDLFSIICKRHLLNFTLKNYKHRVATDIEAYYDIADNEEENFSLYLDSLEKTFLEVIDKHYLGEKRKKYIELTSILVEYLDKNKKIVGKNDILSAYKEYGYKSTEYKKFIEDISKYKKDIYSTFEK